MLDVSAASLTDFDEQDSPRTAPVGDADAAILDAYSNAVISVADKVGPAVVRVETRRDEAKGKGRGGVGSGVIISPDGLVLTNSHVVDGVREVRLTDSEGHEMEARVLVELGARRADHTFVPALDRAQAAFERLLGEPRLVRRLRPGHLLVRAKLLPARRNRGARRAERHVEHAQYHCAEEQRPELPAHPAPRPQRFV